VIEWVGACIDITERKRAEEEQLRLERQLQHSQRLESLGVLAGGIAHDFNNILTAILGHADLALHDMPLSSPGRQGVQEIVNAARRASELSRQMLAYSGRGSFIIEQIDLPLLIQDMVSLLSTVIPKKILLNLNLAKNLPPIEGDVGQINQVIMNLVINAAEAIGERSGVITISTGAQECSSEYLADIYLCENLTPGLYVTLEVSDTGVGMAEETLSRLFEPFFTTKFTGRGLGLSAVLGIVRGHKGGMRIYSELGKGSTFKILFPASKSAAGTAGRPGADSESNWVGQGTVLLVDDEETIRALGARMLHRLGFEVLTAADGREALDMFRAHKDEIVLTILDLTMPHMGGEEAFREIRALAPEARVLMSSGYTENEISARFAGKGTAGFIQKPYTLATLKERIAQALGLGRQTPPA
jgi:nitrogen-specific signal transduction histidine kinase/ActR/RegA family two-component response regulator